MKFLWRKILILSCLLFVAVPALFFPVKPVSAEDPCATVQTIQKEINNLADKSLSNPQLTILLDQKDLYTEECQNQQLANDPCALSAKYQSDAYLPANANIKDMILEKAQPYTDACNAKNGVYTASPLAPPTAPKAPKSPATTTTVGCTVTDPLNPLCTNDIQAVVARLIKFMLAFAGSVALLMFVWGGFQYLWSAGDSGKIKKGKEILMNAGLGLLIMITAYTLITALITALTTGKVT